MVMVHWTNAGGLSVVGVCVGVSAPTCQHSRRGAKRRRTVTASRSLQLVIDTNPKSFDQVAGNQAAADVESGSAAWVELHD